jgi:hypothetical protein
MVVASATEATSLGSSAVTELLMLNFESSRSVHCQQVVRQHLQTMLVSWSSVW